MYSMHMYACVQKGKEQEINDDTKNLIVCIFYVAKY